MKRNLYLVLFLGLLLFQAKAQTSESEPRTIMLLLGSAHKPTLVERVKIAHKLYESDVFFDHIIVSGGCGAHGSSICEATEMKQLLEELGMPGEKIYKEEQSKSTVQNYCFSRKLRNASGEKLIKPGDRLYVVSNHWHAIPVAARFRSYDGVDAVYHVEGQLLPKPTDQVDYTEIYNHELKEEFCRI